MIRVHWEAMGERWAGLGRLRIPMGRRRAARRRRPVTAAPGRRRRAMSRRRVVLPHGFYEALLRAAARAGSPAALESARVARLLHEPLPELPL